MKTILTIVFLAVSAYAQDQAAITRAEAACGPKNVKFGVEVKADTAHHPVGESEAGKALVYIAEDEERYGSKCTGFCGATIKLGLDGTWVGATHGDSYMFFSVDPGEHHLCANWQSRIERFRNQVSLAHFTAEAGHTYYFRMRATAMFDLEPVNDDEGQLLVAASAFSKSQQKK